MMHESVLPTILALVEAGLGIALVPASLAKLKTERLVYRPVVCAEPIEPATLYCAWRRAESEVMPSVQHFIEVVVASRLAHQAIT